MGSWLRNLNGYRRYLQQETTFIELKKEHPELDSYRSRSKIPDPWGDYPRKDVYDRGWKRFRKTQYRVKQSLQARSPKVKVTYDTHWVPRGGLFVSSRCFCGLPFGIRKMCEEMCPGRKRYCTVWTRYRVRESYRRHRVDK